MQLTTFQVLDIAIDCLLFGSLLFVLLDFVRVLPSMIRASWVEVLAKENEVVTDTAKISKPKKSRRKKSRRRRKSKAVQMELLSEGMIPVSKSSATRLTYKKVQADFANKGFTLNRFPSSRFRYRVADLPNCRFKKLEEAMDWLDAQPEPLKIPKHHQLELLDTVIA